VRDLDASTVVEAPITSPLLDDAGTADAITTVTATSSPTRARRPQPAVGRGASERASRSLRSRGSTACVSGRRNGS
jgi:hypothetical protein